MSVSFSKLLTDCLVALGDADASTWSRTNIVWPWAIEAMLEFPILRPLVQTPTFSAAAHYIALSSDFREVISVEYPAGQDPPVYLSRMNRFDPSFYSSEEHYDIDRDYTSGKGWMAWFSKKIPAAASMKINYLANHDTNMTDVGTCYITVPDEYENILLANVVCKGYRERLGSYMQDPTAHTSIIAQMTDMVQHAEENYKDLVKRAQEKLADSKRSPHMQSDKFDRVY